MREEGTAGWSYDGIVGQSIQRERERPPRSFRNTTSRTGLPLISSNQQRIRSYATGPCTMSTSTSGLTRSPSPSMAAPSPKRQKLTTDQAGPSTASPSRTADEPPPPPSATSFPSTASTELPVTFPSSGSIPAVVEDEPGVRALGAVPPNGAGVTKVNGADPVDLSNGSSMSARVDTDDVLLGSKEVGGSNGATVPTGPSAAQAQKAEESDDEEVEELPEPEKEEQDTMHGDMYLDTVSPRYPTPDIFHLFAHLFLPHSTHPPSPSRRSLVKTSNSISNACVPSR